MDNTDSYVVWDVPGQSASILLNLELLDALRRWIQMKPRGISGALLGHQSLAASRRSLLTIEDCDIEASKSEPSGALWAVGFVRENEIDADPDDVVLIVRRVSKDVPMAKLVWRGEATEIPLDSARLKAGGFTILRGGGGVKSSVPRQRSGWRRWAWVPLAAGMAICAALVFWPERNSEEPAAAVIATAQPPAPAPPTAGPLHPRHSAAKPVPRRPRIAPAVATVTIDYRAVPVSAGRSIFSRLRLFPARSDGVYVPARPLRETKPAIPAALARKLSGESRVNLRVLIDKTGQVSHISVLGPGSNPEFVSLARAAVSHWQFEPARQRDLAVLSALDVTFRFRNPVAKNKS